ncbi:polyprenyl synthetase family protein [Actinomadura keratinilytica]
MSPATTSAGRTPQDASAGPTAGRRCDRRWSSPPYTPWAAPERALRSAAAVELTHNFTLLHDDVIDRDRTRRHRPTAWTVFGDADAILAGDALQSLAQQWLAEDPHPRAGAAVARLARCVIELCAGQHTDCALEDRAPTEVSLDECLTMAESKTGALLGCACALGALHADAEPDQVNALDAFGREAGLAFQLIDDIIGIWGDPSRTGKPAGADLTARKKSLPVVAALTSGTAAGAELAERYAGPPEPDELARTIALVEAAAGGTGRRPRRPTGWAVPCSSSPWPSPIRRGPAVCSPWRSSSRAAPTDPGLIGSGRGLIRTRRFPRCPTLQRARAVRELI